MAPRARDPKPRTVRAWRASLSIHGVLEATVFLCVVASVMAWLGRLWWVFELASHFPVQLAALLLVIGIVLLARRRFRWAAAAIVLALVHVATFAGDFVGRPEPAAKPSMRACALNVFIKSQQYADVAAMLQGEKADVVGLVEIDPAWADALTPLAVQWPHVVSEPRERSWGMLLLSRLPILDSETLDLGGAGRVTIRVRVETPDGPVTIILFHPPPPTHPSAARKRLAEMRGLAKLVQDVRRDVGGPIVVMGDYNCTPWSPLFRDLVRDSGLRDSRKSFGIQASWPSPILPLMIPIDHALVSDDLVVVERHLGPRVGSDHLPLILDLAVARPSAE